MPIAIRRDADVRHPLRRPHPEGGPLADVHPSLVADAHLAWRHGLVPAKDRLYQSWYLDEPVASPSKRAAHELFVKRENAIKSHSNDTAIVNIRPRAIQTSTPYSNDLLGSFISSYTKALEKHVSDTSSTACFVYTMSPRQISVKLSQALELFPDPVFFSIDVASADASVTAAFNGVFRRILSRSGASSAVTDFIASNLPIAGRSKHGIKYMTPRGIASGVQYTTTSHSVQALVIWDSLKIQPGQAFLFNKSDDNLLIVHRDNQQIAYDFMAAMLAAGLGTTFTASHELSNAEFLSMRFFGVPGRISSAPKIGRTMSKLFWSVYPTRISDPLDHVATVCHGLRHLVNVPILGPLLRRCAVLAAGARTDAPVSADEWSRLFWVDVYINRDDLLQAYTRMYDTTVHEIETVENMILSIPSLPFVISHPLLDRIIARDLGLEALPNEISTEAPPRYEPINDPFLHLTACANPLFIRLWSYLSRQNAKYLAGVYEAKNFLQNICRPHAENPLGYMGLPERYRLMCVLSLGSAALFEEWLASKSTAFHQFYMLFEYIPKIYTICHLAHPFGAGILIHNLFFHGALYLLRKRYPTTALILHATVNSLVGWFGDLTIIRPALQIANKLPPVVVNLLSLTASAFRSLTGPAPDHPSFPSD